MSRFDTSRCTCSRLFPSRLAERPQKRHKHAELESYYRTVHRIVWICGSFSPAVSQQQGRRRTMAPLVCRLYACSMALSAPFSRGWLKVLLHVASSVFCSSSLARQSRYSMAYSSAIYGARRSLVTLHKISNASKHHHHLSRCYLNSS